MRTETNSSAPKTNPTKTNSTPKLNSAAPVKNSSKPLTFTEIKKLSDEYRAKSHATSKKRKKAVITTCAILFPIELILLALGLTQLPDLNTTHFLILALPILFAALFQILIISFIVFLATYKDTLALAKYHQTYKRLYKAYFIHRQLAKFFTNLHYHHDQGLNRNLLAATRLIYTGDRYSSNDLVIARYKNTNFAQADVHIEERRERRDKDGHVETYYVTTFKGRYLIFEFPKKFEFKMTVSFNGHGSGYINPKTNRGLQRIETESPEFNRRFLVYAEDGFEAFYILNPDFIHKLEQLGEKYKNALSLYFSDNKMYVGLNDGNDTFEPPAISTPLDEKTETEKVINDMKLITNLVDSLKLSK